jgi:hypothetical protein
MKIQFEDRSFIECRSSEHNSNEIIITIQAKDYSNPLRKITNSVTLTIDQFKQLISQIQ